MLPRSEWGNQMKIICRIGCAVGWLLLGVFLCLEFSDEAPDTVSSCGKVIMELLKMAGGVTAIVNVLWQIGKWRKEHKSLLYNKRMNLLRRILSRYMEIRYFIGQICGRAMEANIYDDNVFLRINHLLANQVRSMVMGFSCSPLPEGEILELFDEKVYQLCKIFQTECAALVDESKDDSTKGFKISVPNVKSKIYKACNTFDELMLKCTGIIGGDKGRIEALIRDIANEVIG